MATASCDRCGWQQEYATRQGRSVGLQRHQARDCGPIRRGGNHPARQATLDDRELARWQQRAAGVGLPIERTVDEWVAHPYALDDLLRVLGGTRLEVIAAERTKLRRLTA